MESKHQSGVHFLRLSADGTESKGTILFLHGLAESSLCFESLMKRQELWGWDRLAPDLPGYGKTAWRDPPLPIGRLVEWVADWLDQTNPEDRPIVLGHSMGGVIGQMLCEARPRAVRALVNVEGNLSAGDCDFSKRAADIDLEEFLRSGHQELLDWTYRAGRDAPHLRRYYASMRFADPGAFHLHGTELVELSETEELAHRLARLEVPTLFVAGLDGGMCQRSQQLLDRLGINWSGIEGAGHWPFVDREDAFVGILRAFLDRPGKL